jgi:hypothetical protein
MLAGRVICHIELFVALSVAEFPELFAMWVIAFIASLMLLPRIRQIAEHAEVPNYFYPDIRLNTQTKYISWLEALLVAQVNLESNLVLHCSAQRFFHGVPRISTYIYFFLFIPRPLPIGHTFYQRLNYLHG